MKPENVNHPKCTQCSQRPALHHVMIGGTLTMACAECLPLALDLQRHAALQAKAHAETQSKPWWQRIMPPFRRPMKDVA